MLRSENDKDPEYLIRRYQRAKERRGNWEGHWAEGYSGKALAGYTLDAAFGPYQNIECSVLLLVSQNGHWPCGRFRCENGYHMAW